MMLGCVPVDILSFTRLINLLLMTDDLEFFAYTRVVEVTKELLLAWNAYPGI